MAKVRVIGNLGKDAVVRQGQNGEFATVTIAEHDSKDNTTWWNLVFNNPSHLNLIKKTGLKKGRGLCVDGTYRQRYYTNNEGNQTLSNDIWVDSITFLPGSGTSENIKEETSEPVSEKDSQKEIAEAMQASKKAEPKKAATKKVEVEKEDDYDLPF